VHAELRRKGVTSNLVFSQWDRIFKDAMTTAAAIDRVVHLALILELTGDSYRSEKAKSRKTADKAPRKATGGE
jgi:DNA replication protein DnaC